MTNERTIYSAAYADYAKLEQRVVDSMAGEIEALRKVTTGRATSVALVAVGAALGKATAEFERMRVALRSIEDPRMVLLRMPMPDGSIVDGHARARAGLLTAEELQQAFPDTPLEGKTIAVEYHAPVAPGRRKVGGAQWKNERRGGFSRR